MVNVLFVCTGDTCRSTMASAIFKQILKQNKLNGVRCSSAGLFVGAPLPINSTAHKVLTKLGYSIPSHKSTRLTEDLVLKQNLIICMTNEHKNAVMYKYPYLKEVYAISEILGIEDILDPYGRDESVYNKVARSLIVACNNLVEFLRNREML